MKALGGLVAMGIIACVGGWFVMGKMNADQGYTFANAFGNKDGETIEMHLAIPIAMPEGPKLDERGNPLWDEWVADHFNLTSDSGDKLEIERLAHSLIIPEHKIGGSPEFYLKPKLHVGTKYTFDFIPYSTGKKKYRMEFTAPAAQTELKRDNFNLVKS